jgi:hypothetical protein
MITIAAFKWVPPFAQRQVRDHRVRWVHLRRAMRVQNPAVKVTGS